MKYFHSSPFRCLQNTSRNTKHHQASTSSDIFVVSLGESNLLNSVCSLTSKFSFFFFYIFRKMINDNVSEPQPSTSKVEANPTEPQLHVKASGNQVLVSPRQVPVL